MLFPLPSFTSISSFFKTNLSHGISWILSTHSYVYLFPYFFASTFLKFTNQLPSTSFSTSPFLYSRHVPLFMSFLHLISHLIHFRCTFSESPPFNFYLFLFLQFSCILPISLRSKITRFKCGDYVIFLGCRKCIGCHNKME